MIRAIMMPMPITSAGNAAGLKEHDGNRNNDQEDDHCVSHRFNLYPQLGSTRYQKILGAENPLTFRHFELTSA